MVIVIVLSRDVPFPTKNSKKQTHNDSISRAERKKKKARMMNTNKLSLIK
jgi:hypothetical protein